MSSNCDVKSGLRPVCLHQLTKYQLALLHLSGILGKNALLCPNIAMYVCSCVCMRVWWGNLLEFKQ